MGNLVKYEDTDSKELMLTEREQTNLWKTAPRGLENSAF